MKSALGWGYVAYFVVAIALAVITGIWSEMTPFKLVIWIIYAAFAAIASELIVRISAMYSGWFPGFATALIFLLVGMLIGFPSMPLAVLVAYTAATGPAFSDMAYDLKCGYILRGYGKDPELEKVGRKQQFISEIVGFTVAFVMVALLARTYFSQGLYAPVDATFAATIEAGAGGEVAKWLTDLAVPGAIIQLLGGSRQVGIFCNRSSRRKHHQRSYDHRGLDHPCDPGKEKQRKRAHTQHSGCRRTGRCGSVQLLYGDACPWKQERIAALFKCRRKGFSFMPAFAV